MAGVKLKFIVGDIVQQVNYHGVPLHAPGPVAMITGCNCGSFQCWKIHSSQKGLDYLYFSDQRDWKLLQRNWPKFKVGNIVYYDDGIFVVRKVKLRKSWNVDDPNGFWYVYIGKRWICEGKVRLADNKDLAEIGRER